MLDRLTLALADSVMVVAGVDESVKAVEEARDVRDAVDMILGRADEESFLIGADLTIRLCDV